MIAPKDGTYTPADSNRIDNCVVLEVGETPATSLGERIGKLVDNVAMVGGMILSVSGLVTYLAPTLLGATVTSVMSTGSFFLSGYSIFKYFLFKIRLNCLSKFFNILKNFVYSSLNQGYDKFQHDEGIRTEVSLLLSSLLTFSLNAYSRYMRTAASKFASDGKIYHDFLNSS